MKIAFFEMPKQEQDTFTKFFPSDEVYFSEEKIILNGFFLIGLENKKKSLKRLIKICTGNRRFFI